jgi:hypothetical protein
MLYCTYHPSGEHYHKYFVNFGLIADNDAANGIAIRVCEQRTEERIALLRKRFGIPEDELPPDEWLWLDEHLVSPSVMTVYAGGLRSRGTLTRTLAERSPNPRRRSLIELNYAESRYIAKRSYYAGPPHDDPATEVYQDWQGERFIVVDDWHGYYIDPLGELHDATEEGWIVTKQYRFLFDRVNAAIARRNGNIPPALPRWQQKRGVAPAQETPIAGAVMIGCHTSVVEQTSEAILGGNLNFTYVSSVSTQNDITPSPSLSISASSQDDLRHAPWNMGTFTRLMAATLQDLAPEAAPLPDRASLTDDRWHTEVQEPLERLFAEVADQGPARGWQETDLTARYMCTQGSPSWWQRDKRNGGRKTKAPVTIKQIANQRVIGYADYLRHDWHPSQITPYDGPPLEEDATPSPRTQERATDALPVLPRGMLRSDAQALCDEIWRQVPLLKLMFLPVEDDRVFVSFEYEEDTWHDLASPEKWHRQSPKLRRRVAAALALARARDASASIDMTPEPPIIMAPAENVPEPPLSVINQQEDPSPQWCDDVRRGLLYADKQGMGPIVAGMLQEQIKQDVPDCLVDRTYLRGDRIVLMVKTEQCPETAIDSVVAWHEYLALRRPPITSAVLPITGALTMEQPP